MTVVVGYVARPEGRAALQAAVEEARRTRERLVVVTVPRPATSGSAARGFGPGGDDLEALLAGEPFPHEVRRGRGDLVPADALLHAVTECRARLLVIGMRGRPVMGRLLPGATAQQLVLECPCDVLTVRGPAR
jgi:nucleotide-binding universal stress UspA family protein